MHNEDYLIKSDTLDDIADAIREKDGSQEPIQVNNFASSIRSLPSGGTSIVGDGIKVYLSANQNMNKNTFTKINVDTVDYNTSTCFTYSNNAVHIGSGVSMVMVLCRYTAWEQAQYNKYIYVYKNGTQIAFLSAMYDATLETICMVPVEEGDYLELWGYQESDRTLAVMKNSKQTYIEVIAMK